MVSFTTNILIASYFEVITDGVQADLLPFGHSRHFPLSFNLNDRTITSGSPNFFNQPFYKNFDTTRFIDPSKCEFKISQLKNSLIVLNLLDNCFGHSLLKLFDSVKKIDEKNMDYDFLLLMPKALKHFLKIGPGINVIYVNVPFSELEKCYLLNHEIEKISSNYEQVFLEGTETYNTYDFNKTAEKLNLMNGPEVNESCDKIVFYYRADYYRMWNGSKQGKNIKQLFVFLKSFFSPSTQFIVVGDYDKHKFPSWIRDERIKKFSVESDFHYNKLFKGTLICIGLTGSHMLFPSLLSTCTVHLHPSFKYKNMAEDIIVDEHANEMISAYKHLYYHGNYNCSDLKPKKLGWLLILHFQGLIEKKYKMEKHSVSQEEWLVKNYPEFNYSKVSEFRSTKNAKENNKIRLRSLIDKCF